MTGAAPGGRQVPVSIGWLPIALVTVAIVVTYARVPPSHPGDERSSAKPS